MEARLMPVSISSSDRDLDVYPEPNHYVANLPFPIHNVGGIALASLEMPGTKTQLTIEEGINDKFTFSEGLRIDLGEATRSVQSTDMFNNQLMIKEGDDKYVISIPSYLAQITGFGGSNDIESTDTESSGTSSWYSCYVNWRNTQSEPKPPALKVVGGSIGYVEEVTSTGTLTDTGNNSSFTHGFVHLDALSIKEICSYLTYALANYTTYSSSPSTRPSNQYTFEYYLGKVRVRASSNTSSPTIHFPTTANQSQTPFYQSQDTGFVDRMQLNSSGGQLTSLGSMLGLSSSSSLSTKTYVYKNRTKTCLGFHSRNAPKCLFEAKLRHGIYTQSSLATNLPIAMNPLHFVSSLNTATTGACYFGFLDSSKNERLLIINEGKYTPETFCQALEHGLNRLDENGVYASRNRFAYKGAPLNHERSQAWPALTLEDVVVYNVYYDYDTRKFTLESSWASSIKPFDPSTAVTLDTSRPAPTFGLLFDPTSLARIAPQISNLSSLCTNSNVDRIANVLGFHLQDYQGTGKYTSDAESWIPRVNFPLSQGFPPSGSRHLFKDENPEDLGIGQTDATGCGTPLYMFPRGRYRVTGFVPVQQSLNLSTGATYSHESVAEYTSTGVSSRPSTAITTFGFRTNDYDLSPPSVSQGAHLTTQMYLAINNTDAGGDAQSASIIRIDSVDQAANSPMATGTLIDMGTGVGTSGATREFIPIAAHDNVRFHSVTNTSSGNERCMLLSTHSNGHGTHNEAYMTTMPFGFQVGDVVKMKCLSEALTKGNTSGVSITVGSVLGMDQGLVKGATYDVAGGTAVLGEYHTLYGGRRNAIVKVTTGGGVGVGKVQVIESGSRYYPSATYTLSTSMMPFEFEGVVTQQANSGGHFQDSDNTQRDQFFTCVPYLASSISTCASKNVDGACVRVRIPYALNQLTATFARSGNMERIAEYAPPRVDVHIEDENMYDRLKPLHAQNVLGSGRRNLNMDYTLAFPYAMNVDPVHYVMVKFFNLNNRRSEQVHYTKGKVLRDVAGKVVLGAPTTLVRSIVTRVEFAPTTLTEVELAFFLPDGETKYNFHGLDHTLTLNLMIMERKRKFDNV